MCNYKIVKIFIGDNLYNEYTLDNITNNKLEYHDDSCHNTIEFIENNIKLTRENEEFSLIIYSNEKEALYILKELNYELNIKVNYFDQINEKDSLIICYQLETNDLAVKLVLEGE